MYAYLDRDEILRIVKNERTAKEYAANGKVIETDVPATGGLPLVTRSGAKKDVYIYNLNEMYVGGGKARAKKENLEDYAQYGKLYNLYKKLM